MVVVVDALALLWMARVSFNTRPRDIDFDGFMKYYTRHALTFIDPAPIFIWDNLALKHVEECKELDISSGPKYLDYTTQITARINQLKTFINSYYKWINEDARWSQMWSVDNTADDVMYMYIANIQKNSIEKPMVAMLVHSKSLLGLIDESTFAFHPEVSTPNGKVHQATLTYEKFKKDIGCDPGIFMVRRAMRGDITENIPPIDLPLSLMDEIEWLALRAHKQGKINFFVPDEASTWFTNIITGHAYNVQQRHEWCTQFRNNYARIKFLRVSRLYVKRPEEDT